MIGPEHALLHDQRRAEYVAASDSEALAAALQLSRVEGIIPALESAHAVAEAIPPRARRRGQDVFSSTCPAAATRISTSIARTFPEIDQP